MQLLRGHLEDAPILLADGGGIMLGYCHQSLFGL